MAPPAPRRVGGGPVAGELCGASLVCTLALA